MKRRIALVIGAALLCCCRKNDAIVVGSKNFTEQIVLGEMAAQQLERKLHVRIERKLDLGGTLLTHEAILRGDIDIYPEYTGTAASVILKQETPADPVRAYILVKDAYLQRFQLVWLPPLGFDDTFAMAVRRQDASKLAEPTLSAAASRKWRLGIGYEFLTRPDGLQRLNKIYAIQWDGIPKSMDLGLLYQALQQKSIDMGAGNSTDAQLSNPNFTALRDDRKAFPPYNACYVVRRDLIRERPQVEWALSMLQNRVSEETMRRLNRSVDIDHQPVEKVVKEFLTTQP